MTGKEYIAPKLTILGDVEDITKSADQVNADSPQGIANTAFPVAGS